MNGHEIISLCQKKSYSFHLKSTRIPVGWQRCTQNFMVRDLLCLIYANAAAGAGSLCLESIVITSHCVEPLLFIISLHHFDHCVVDVSCGEKQPPLRVGGTGRLGDVQLKTFLFNLQVCVHLCYDKDFEQKLSAILTMEGFHYSNCKISIIYDYSRSWLRK